MYAIFVKISKWLKLLNSVPFIKKTYVNHVYNWILSFWLTFTVLQWIKKNLKKNVNLKISADVRDCNLGLNFKMTEASKYCIFIKKTLVNNVYNWVWLFRLPLAVLHWMNTNFKIGLFSRFLLRSRYAILVKIRKWLKLLNSVPFIKKTRGHYVYNGIRPFWLMFTVLQWMKKNFKISQFSKFLLRSGYAILV